MAKSQTVLSLKLIAALAEKLANDLEAGRLWEGEYAAAASQIKQAAQEL